MQSQVDEISPVLVAVKVEVPWEQVEKDLDQAYRKVQKTARIRGFRPGKVPRNVVKNLMGPSVRSEVANQLVQQGLSSAVDQHSLDLVAVPEVEPDEMVDGSPFKFTAKVEIRPKISAIDTEALAVERTRVRVGDAAVDAELQRLREQNGELVTPEPTRPCQKDDLVTLSVQVSVDGTVREDLGTADNKAQLGQGQLLPELEEGLLGMEIGQEKSIQVTLPAEGGQPELRGKTLDLQVTLKEIQEKQLPQLDDEFAKDLEYESLTDMRDKVRAQLDEAADQKADAQLRDAVVQKLIDNNPVPVPPSMVSRQAQGMIQEMMQFQRYLGQPFQLNDETQQEMMAEAERKVRGGLLFGEIARSQNLAVVPEEIEKEFESIAERTGQHIAKVRAEHQGQRRQHLESRLLENKLLEYLLSKATITETEVDEKPSSGEAQE